MTRRAAVAGARVARGWYLWCRYQCFRQLPPAVKAAAVRSKTGSKQPPQGRVRHETRWETEVKPRFLVFPDLTGSGRTSSKQTPDRRPPACWASGRGPPSLRGLFCSRMGKPKRRRPRSGGFAGTDQLRGRPGPCAQQRVSGWPGCLRTGRGVALITRRAAPRALRGPAWLRWRRSTPPA